MMITGIGTSMLLALAVGLALGGDGFTNLQLDALCFVLGVVTGTLSRIAGLP